MFSSILETKLFATVSGIGSIERARLFNRLDEGVAAGKKVTLVSAPAGYGKSTLISGWVNKGKCLFSWVSLDEGDNDPVRFFSYLIASLKSVESTIGNSLAGLLESSVLPPTEVLISEVVNDITKAGLTFVLALDDYHIIRNELIHEVIQRVMDHVPPILNLVLVTREDPPLSLAKWRVQGQLNEIRAQDLKFNHDEATAFFQHRAHLKLDCEEIASLVNLTEGWIAGLQLVAVSLEGRSVEKVRKFIDDFNGSHRYVIDYLMEEVLKTQEPEVRDFLTRTSVLDMLCPSLCDAVTNRRNSGVMLGKLEQANLFLVSQDDYREWFRYHHLFADFLRTQLTKTLQTELHKKAASWYEANGYIEHAVKHILASGDVNAAKSMVLRVACPMMEIGNTRTFIEWVDALPNQLVLDDDELFSFKAFALFSSGRMEEAGKCISSIDYKSFSQMPSDAQGRFLIIKAWFAMVWEDESTLKDLEETLSIIEFENPLLKIFSLIVLGQIQRCRENIEASSQTVRKGLTLAQQSGATIHQLTASIELVINLNYQGKLREALEICHNAFDTNIKPQNKLFPQTGALYILMGIIHYEMNKISEAKDLLVKGFEILKRLGFNRAISGDSERFLAKVLYITGEKEAAFQLLKEILEDTKQFDAPSSVFKYSAQEADLNLKEGHLNEAARWAEDAGISPNDHVNLLQEDSYCVYIRILIAQKRYNDAQILLDKLEHSMRESGCCGRLITVCILQALVEQKTNDLAEAKAYIEEAVRIAAPEGFIRSFLDEGQDIIYLLQEVQHISPEFINDILHNIDPNQSNLSQTVSLRTKSVDRLSERELEILRHIAGGLSNAKIAQKLHVTEGTVKWHAYNIYSKLNVKTRIQAVAEARELGLIN